METLQCCTNSTRIAHSSSRPWSTPLILDLRPRAGLTALGPRPIRCFHALEHLRAPRSLSICRRCDDKQYLQHSMAEISQFGLLQAPHRAALPASKQTPRSCPRQSLSQPNAISTTLSNAADPPVKRQKVDNEPCKSRSEAHVNSAPANDLHARNTSAQQASDDRSAKGVPGRTSLVSSQDKNQILRSGSPLLPLRPSRKPTNGSRSSIRPSAVQRVTSRGNVQNKPYVFEAPPSAPHFRDDGESVLEWKVTKDLAKDCW